MKRPVAPHTRSALVFVLVAATLAIAGCSATPTAPVTSAAPTATATPTPTASAEPVVNPGGTAPPQAFGGDCNAVFTASDVSSVGGWDPASAVGFVNTVPDMALVHQVGGLGCVWSPAEGTEGYLQVTVVPQKILSNELENGTTCFLQYEKTYICAVDVESNGYHLSANLTTANTSSYEAANLASASLAQIFTAHAEAQPKAQVLNPRDGSWPLDFTCRQLDRKAKVAKALDNPGLELSDGGGDVQVTAAETDLWGGRPFLRCYWRQNEGDAGTVSQLTVAVLGGAAWTQLEVAALPGAEEVSVDGAERAFVVTDPEGSGSDVAELHIFDGVNWFVLTSESSEPSALYAAVPALIKGLGKL